MLIRRLIAGLLAAALLLPTAIVLCWGLGSLLSAMKDPAGANALSRLALALAIAWILSLFCLLLATAAAAVGRDERRE